MENFDENNLEQANENIQEPETDIPGDAVTDENETATYGEPPVPPYQPPAGNAPAWNRINYTEPQPIKDYTPFSKGLKIFCAVLAAVILMTAACAGGYFLGRNANGVSGFYRNDVKLDLSAKPKNQDGMTAAEVYDALNPSIVGIRVYNSSTAYDASGVIYTDDGYIITNDHIYSSVGAPKFKIYTFDGKEYDANYVAGDAVSDLAVLKVKDASGFKAAEFGNSNELVCGENVFAVGRPSDASDDTSITSGTVSLTNRRVRSKTNYSSSLIQTDSAINPGSSGGALSNMYGQVIGITSSKLSGSDYDAIGFAIPTVTVKRVVDQLISNGKVTDRAKLGITYTEINSVSKQIGNYAATGLLIQSVSTDSELYGKAEKDDIITHINGIEITKDDIVLDIIEASKAGDSITVTVLAKSGGQNDYTVKLGANIGESSFKIEESAGNNPDDDNSSEPGGTFDFPFGE